MYLVGNIESPIPLCLDCRLKAIRVTAIQLALTQRMLNHTLGMGQFVAGLRATPPAFPEIPVLEATEMTLSNINISNSTVGVVNTGSIETVDVAITSLRQTGSPEVALAIQELTNAIISYRALDESKRKDALDLLGLVAGEATAPAERRRSGAIRPLLSELAVLIGGIADLDQLVTKYLPVLLEFFR